MFIRPGVNGLIASLMRCPGCEFALCSGGVGRDYFLPMAKHLLQAAVPGDWVVEESEPPCIACEFLHLRVHVFDYQRDQDLSCVWRTLCNCGHGRFGVQNTVLVDVPWSTLHRENVIVPPWWTAVDNQDDETQVDGLRRYLLRLLGARPKRVCDYLQEHQDFGHPCAP